MSSSYQEEIQDFFHKGKLHEKQENLFDAADCYEKGLNLLIAYEKDLIENEEFKSLLGERRDIEKRLNKIRSELQEAEEEEEIEYELAFSLPEVVRLFTIDGEVVSPPSEPTSLQVLKSGDSFILQVGTWVYPLEKKIPVMLNEFGAYIFPNPTPENPEGLELGGKFEHKTEKMSAKIEKRGEKYRAKTASRDRAVAVPRPVKGGVVVVHKGTTAVAKVTTKIVTILTDVSNAIGKRLAKGAQKVVDKDKVGATTGTIEVLGGGAMGFGALIKSLEKGSKTLIVSLSGTAVQNVQHKYGDEAAATTSEMFQAGSDVAEGGINIVNLTHRSLATIVGTTAGMKTVTDLYTANCVDPKDPLMAKLFVHLSPPVDPKKGPEMIKDKEGEQLQLPEAPPPYEVQLLEKDKHL